MPVTEFNLKDLQAAATALNASGELQRLGTCDARFGVCAGRRRYTVLFDAFECTAVRLARKRDLASLDFAIEMTPEGWAKYLRALGTKREKGLADIDVRDPIVTGTDPLRRLNFSRYHRTFDALFRSLR